MKNNTFEKINLYLLYITVFLIPIAFWPKLYDVFELFKISLLQYLVVTIYFIWFLKILKDKKLEIKTTFQDTILFSLFFIFALSILFSIQKVLSLKEFTKWITFLLFYIALCNFANKKTRWVFIYLIVFSSLVISVYGILQHNKIDFVLWTDPVVHLRCASTLGNPNFVAGYLSLSIPIIFALILFERKTTQKAILILILLLNFICILYTFGRGGWLACALAICTILFFAGKRILFENKYPLVILSILSIFIFYFISREKIVFDKREQNIISRLQTFVDIKYPSSQIRLHLWDNTIKMIRDRPITGWGLDTFTFAFFRYRSPELSSLAGRTNLPESAHNEYLQIAQSTGFIGLFLFLFLTFYVLYSLYMNIKNEINKELNIIIFSGMLSFFVQSIFYYKVNSTLLIFFTLLALANLNKIAPVKTVEINFPIILKIFIIPLTFLTYILILVNISIPLVADYYFQRGINFFVSNKYKQALEKYTIALSLNSYNREYATSIPNIYEHLITMLPETDENRYRKIYFLEEAEKRYKEILKIHKNDPFLIASLARVYFVKSDYDKKYIKESIKYYKKSTEIDPYNCIFYNDLGLAYLKDKKIQLAIKNFEHAKKLDPTWELPYANLGLAYSSLKNTQKAKLFFEKAININPKNHQFYFYLGLLHFEEKNYTSAISSFKKAQKISPSDINVQYMLKKAEEKIHKTKN